MTVKSGDISIRVQEIRDAPKTIPTIIPARPEPSYFFFKRSLDLGLSILVAGTIFPWLMPLLALLIKMDSRGPVFFLQKRMGKGGKVFTCYKLRTMVVNRHADEHPAQENDKRVTRIGLFLRRSHLDEVPQLLNVLSGSMSLVGPRPYMLTDDERFSALVPEYRLRNLVKPGITGLAQVKGYHGQPVPGLSTIIRRSQWDGFYVRNASFLLDLHILYRTIRLFLTQKMSLCK